MSRNPYKTLNPLPLEDRFVLPDIVDQHSISFDDEVGEAESAIEDEVQEYFDFGIHQESYIEYESEYYEKKHIERKKSRGTDKATYESRQTVEEWLDQSQKSIVLGGPGTGKSALLRFIILDLLREAPTLKILASKWGNKLPVWIPFGRWTRMIANSGNSKDSLPELLELWFENWGEEESWVSVERALQDERLLLLVDGLDEWSNETAASVALQRLQVFIEQRDLPARLSPYSCAKARARSKMRKGPALR